MLKKKIHQDLWLNTETRPPFYVFCFQLTSDSIGHFRQSANPKEVQTGALNGAMFAPCKTNSLFPKQIWVGKIFIFSSKTIFVHVEKCHASLRSIL